ncbi:MAG: tyrosine-protein phosphatase [Deltaproteobacteria bacterium]
MKYGRHIKLEGAGNFRDLGGFPAVGGLKVKMGRVFRADGLHRLSPADIETLEGLGISRVFDLRSDLELASDGVGEFARRNGRHTHVPLVAVALNPFDSKIDWANMNLNERYLEMLKEGGSSIATVLGALDGSEPGAVLFHCSGGKDRTGVLAALLLRILGVDDQDIIDDYAVSERFLGGFIDKYRDALVKMGMDEDSIAYLTSSPPGRMVETLAKLDSLWGSTDDYLDSIGVGSDLRRRLRDNLLV